MVGQFWGTHLQGCPPKFKSYVPECGSFEKLRTEVKSNNMGLDLLRVEVKFKKMEAHSRSNMLEFITVCTFPKSKSTGPSPSQF